MGARRSRELLAERVGQGVSAEVFVELVDHGHLVAAGQYREWRRPNTRSGPEQGERDYRDTVCSPVGVLAGGHNGGIE